MRHRFEIEVGVLTRYAVHELHRAALMYGVQLKELSNDGGWLSRAYIMEVSGPERNVRAYLRAVTDYIRRVNE
jgi:hypothetical protein